MMVFDGSMIYYFNINSSLKEPRYELKDGEIDLLTELGSAVPCLDIARNLGENNNFTDMNKLIDAFWKKQAEEKKFRTERELLLLINKEKMDGLSHTFDFYQNEIGFTYYLENSFSEALPYFENAIAINSSGIGSNGQSYNFNYGLALYSEGASDSLNKADNWNKAMDYLDKALIIVPDKPQAIALKGNCLYKMKKYNEAIACLSMAIDKKFGILTNNQKKDVFATRAKCYSALGMNDKADKDNAEAERLAKLPA
jgi:tetratricopeptide (TPR) repeat protein